MSLVAAGSIPFWIAGAIAADPSLRLPVDLPLSALMVVCPLGAAVALTHRDLGTAGVRRFLRRAVDAGCIRPLWLWAPLLGLLPSVATGAWLVQRSLGEEVPAPVVGPASVIGFGVLYLASAVVEELGWTAYATDAMLSRHDALTTGATIGLAWALWHVIPYVQAGRSTGWILWQCLFTVALRVVIVSAYGASHRSVAATVMVHASANLSWSLFPVFGSHYDPKVTGVLLSGVAVVAAIAWGPRTLAPPGRGSASLGDSGPTPDRGRPADARDVA